MEKVSLAACNGMSNYGLIARAVSSDLTDLEPNVNSICITSTSADNKPPKIIEKYPIIALNGCSNGCVDKILKNKGIKVSKTIDIMNYSHEHGYKAGGVVRLGKTGENTVKKLSQYILEVIRNIG